jgi:PAS domain S-box-containing protein
MKRNLAIIILTFVVLLLVISLALHLHRQSKKEVLGQFNDRQLDVARQLAREIESHLRAYSVCLHMLASFPSLQYRDMRKVPSDIQTTFEFVKKIHAKAISLYDERENIIYSTNRSTIGLSDTRRELYDWAKKKDNKGKVFITSLPQMRGGEKRVRNAGTASESLKPPSPQLLLATPLYQEDVHAGSPKIIQKFVGLLLLTVDIEELLAEHLVFIGPKMKLHQVWLMDRDGTLLFQSEHPEMGLRDIYQRDDTCHHCHISFDYAEKMLKEMEGTAEYQLKGQPKKLAAFAPMKFENASWIVVADAPFKKVVSFVTRSLRDTLWLLGIVILALMGGLTLVRRDYRLKVRAEEQAKQWREKRALEDKIRESEERYRHLVELSPDAVTVHCEGLIAFVNTAGARLIGAANPEELIGKPIIDFVHPDYREMAEGRIQGMKQKGNKVPLVEEKFIRLDGTVIDVEVAAIPFTYQGKRGVQVVAHDITVRKRAEREIQKLNEDLIQRAIELEAANRELEAFSYSVSHDLRNPLLVIESFSRRLLEKYASDLDPKGQRYLNIIKENTKNMSQLIDDLLAFSRLGRQGINPSPFDMVELAKTVFEELRSITPDRTFRFTVDHLPPAQGDPAMIRQVLVNLLSNAIKFTRSAETAVIEMDGRVEENENIYSVKDNGVGFDMEHHDKLFDVFQRLHPPEEFEGTGVGLATVQRIIHRHGGRVWAEGVVNKGATFYFTLPRT